MRDIAEELINLKFKETDTFKDCLDMFYSVMRKHKIKNGTKEENGGVLLANHDWTMCQILFIDRIRSFFEIDCFLFNETPEDLLV